MNSSKNIQLLTDIISRHFKSKMGVIIGEEEYHLINAVVEKLSTENDTLDNLNKKAIVLIHDIITKKRTKNEVKVPEKILDSMLNINQEIQEEYVLIDSRFRDTSLYPNCNSYRYVFPSEFHNITRIELITAEIPRTGYLITTENNTILFQETSIQESGGFYTSAVVPFGNYTAPTLKNAIETAMNNSSSTGAVFNVDISSLSPQNKLIISSDLGGTATLFNLKLGNLRIVLGFTPAILTGSSSYTSDNVINLSPENYLVLKLNNVKCSMRSSNVIFDNGFCKIPLGDTGSNKFFSTNNDFSPVVELSPPMTSLPYLDIEFYDFNGIHNFNGLEHSLTFKVTYVNSTSI